MISLTIHSKHAFWKQDYYEYLLGYFDSFDLGVPQPHFDDVQLDHFHLCHLRLDNLKLDQPDLDALKLNNLDSCIVYHPANLTAVYLFDCRLRIQLVGLYYHYLFKSILHRRSPPPDADATNFVAQINHFVQDDGLNAFRLPVSWQYLINQFDGGSLGANKLDSSNFANYDTLVQGCLDSGASLCIVDIHNYARFNGYIVGQDGPSADQFASLWSQIATKYASESRVGFGLMNEPHDQSCTSADGNMDIDTWASTLQTVVNAIRAAGATSQLIILPGKGWTHSITYLPASGDGSGPALMGITDPAGGTSKLVFEVHEYLDANNAGGSSDCVTNSIDSSYYRGGLQNLADYLRSSGRVAMITESGGLNNANCATYLCQERKFLANNTDVFLGYTTWAAGGFDSSYELAETPTQNGGSWTDTSLVQACVAKCFTGSC